MSGFEAVIGLEVHAQLSTRSKIFCGCRNGFGGAPNSRTCPVCLGRPGALPVLNERVVEMAVRTATALGCTVHSESRFARKNYFYPDLPKGYQISQYDRPLAEGGRVAIEADGGSREIELIRLHLEEDAGKLVHDGGAGSGVDLNRAGTPLVEIVSTPSIRSPAEAYLFLQRLRSLVRYIDVCDGNMEQGSFRCDANVSIRPAGQRELGTRTELKNLNSFRNVRRALEHEIARQTEIVESGSTVRQQTVLWDAAAGETRPMRGKEEAHDYRYFPDPDLPPLVVRQQQIDAALRDLPELPAARKQRFVEQYRLDPEEAHALTLDPELADYFEATAEASNNAKATANWLLNDLLRERNASGRSRDDFPVKAAELGRLIRMLDDNKISPSAARQTIFPEMCRSGRGAAAIVAEQGLEQVSDDSVLQELIDRVLDEHPGQVAKYRAGHAGLLGFLVGKVLKESQGKADPRRVNEMIRSQLDEKP